MIRFNFISILIFFILFTSCKNNKDKRDDSLNKVTNYVENEKVKFSNHQLSKIEKNKLHEKLSAYFDSTLLKTNFNGGILVAKNGIIVYEKYVGYTQLTLGNKINQTTPFHIASTSKTFTGMMILKMVQEGKLSLEDDIQIFFPELIYTGIKIKNLLSHRSGLPNYLHEMDDKLKADSGFYSNNDVLNFFIKNHPPLHFIPDTHFSYSNTNFVLLALIIEKISKTTYSKYITKNIFEPLGMKQSFVFTLSDSSQIVQSYYPNGKIWAMDRMDATYGDKNIYSTPQDLLKWDLAVQENLLVSKLLTDSAFKPYSLERKSMHNYGLGWRMISFTNGKKIIYHNGRWHGFNAAFAHLVDENATIIILGNRFSKQIYNCAHDCFSIFGSYFSSIVLEDENSDDKLIKSENLNKEKSKIIKKSKQP